MRLGLAVLRKNGVQEMAGDSIRISRDYEKELQVSARAKATIADVARLAGVSTATAGRVLGGYGYASGDTKEQVLKAALALDYRPNALARSLITGKTRTIGVVAGDIQNPFYASMIRGISDVVEQRGFGLLITNSDERLENELRSVELLMEKQVDGLIVSPCDTRKAQHLRALHTAGVPLVLVDRAVAGLDVDRVAAENVGASRAAVASLIAAGHRRIGVVAELVDQDGGGISGFIERVFSGETVATDKLYPSWQRLLGYIQAHRAAGVPIDPGLVRRAGQYSEDAGKRQALDLLSMPGGPTALFTTDGTMSAGVMAAISALNRRIPQDLSLICFDDLDWMSFLSPGITAIAQPRFAMGEVAAKLLLDRIDARDAPARSVTLAPTMIVRNSVQHGV